MNMRIYIYDKYGNQIKIVKNKIIKFIKKNKFANPSS